MRNFSFNPATLNINVGDIVTWTNAQGQHDTICGSSAAPCTNWNSNINFGRFMRFRETFSFTFNTSGSFTYHCGPHETFGMTGTINVIAPNVAPTISITSPENGQDFSAPANITVQASASDSDGSVAQVEFFLNGNSLGTSPPPYQASANNLGPGNYTFSAVATDNSGATATQSVSITVTGAGPAITTPPVSQIVTSSNDVNFTVEANGTPPLFYQWFFNESPLAGETGTSLTLTNVTTNASGTYTIGVANEFGSNSASATLLVTNIVSGTPPTILVDLQSQTVPVLSNATFSVTAIGSPPLSYQWFVWAGYHLNTYPESSDGSFTIAPWGPAYVWVVVNNTFGSVTSSIVSLCVTQGCSFRLSETNASFGAMGGSNVFHVGIADTHNYYRDPDYFGTYCPSDEGYFPEDIFSVGNSRNTSQKKAITASSIITVPIGNYCAWDGNFSCTNSWIHPSPQFHVYAFFWMDFTVDPNTNTSPRTGVITVEGNDFIITQAGAVYGKDSDFNLDGRSDFLFQNSDGRLAIWHMNGTTNLGSLLLRNGKPATPGWQVVASHDFSGDGKTDLLWQNVNGSLAIWFMDGTTFLRSEPVSSAPKPNPVWRFAGLGDFTGDGKADILFRNSQGYLLLWQMNGKKFVKQELLFGGDPVPTAWKIAGVADFTSDQKPDILWINNTGSLLLWTMNGKSVTSGKFLPGIPKITHARVTGLNDLNQDGKVDLILRHNDGRLSVWYLNGTNRIGTAFINNGSPVAPSWTLVAPKN